MGSHCDLTELATNAKLLEDDCTNNECCLAIGKYYRGYHRARASLTMVQERESTKPVKTSQNYKFYSTSFIIELYILHYFLYNWTIHFGVYMHAKKIFTHSYVNELNLLGTGNKATTHSSWKAYYLTLITVAISTLTLQLITIIIILKPKILISTVVYQLWSTPPNRILHNFKLET